MTTIFLVLLALVLVAWFAEQLRTAPVIEPPLIGKRVSFSDSGETREGSVIDQDDEILTIASGENLYKRLDFEVKVK